MGLQARLLSQAMRKLTSSISKSNTCAIFLLIRFDIKLVDTETRKLQLVVTH